MPNTSHNSIIKKSQRRMNKENGVCGSGETLPDLKDLKSLRKISQIRKIEHSKSNLAN